MTNKLGLACTGGSERAYLDGSCVRAVPYPGLVRSKSRLPETAHGKRPGEVLRAHLLSPNLLVKILCHEAQTSDIIDLAADCLFFSLLRRLGAPFPLRSHWGQLIQCTMSKRKTRKVTRT